MPFPFIAIGARAEIPDFICEPLPARPAYDDDALAAIGAVDPVRAEGLSPGAASTLGADEEGNVLQRGFRALTPGRFLAGVGILGGLALLGRR